MDMTGADFKKELRAGKMKLGLFLNSHSPTVAEQLAHSGYDWLLVDTQHGPMGNESLSGMLAGISKVVLVFVLVRGVSGAFHHFE